jgi:WD40 repeat protein
MFSNQVAEVSLNAPAKCLEAVKADKVESRFLVGTCSVSDANELTVLRFHSELNELAVDATLDHPSGPVGCLCTNPTDKYLLLSAAEENPTVNLWRVPQEAMDRTDELDYSPETDGGGLDPSDVHSLELVTTLPHDADSHIVDLAWRDDSVAYNDDYGESSNAASGEVLTLDRAGQVTQWDITAAQSIRSQIVADPDHQMTPPRVKWDPHHSYAAAVTAGAQVHLLDWRTDTSIATGTCSIFTAHRYGVTDVDFNPNKPHVVATAGQDGLLKFWDLRNSKKPLLSARGGHSHYAWQVQYNPFHDQLLVSTGTDAVVNLWRVSTISSAPLLTVEDDEGSAPNVRVSRYEHGDSVYGMAWGASDAWIYATVGYDGKVVLNHVPSREKYKILL